MKSKYLHLTKDTIFRLRGSKRFLQRNCSYEFLLSKLPIYFSFIYLIKGISCFISSNLKYMWITFHIFKVETCLQMLSLWRKTKTKIFFSQKFEYWSLLCKKPLNSFLQSPFSSCTTRKETKSTRIFKNRKKKRKEKKIHQGHNPCCVHIITKIRLFNPKNCSLQILDFIKMNKGTQKSVLVYQHS